MKVLELIEDFQRKLDEIPNFMMTKKVLIEREELEAFFTNVQTFLPDEMKHASWIKKDREKIIDEANKSAELIVDEARKKENMIIKEARTQFDELVSENHVLKEAEERANKLVQRAKEEASIVRNNSYTYSEDMLINLKSRYLEKLKEIDLNLKDLQEYLEQK